jgi:hypothetical protein
MLGEGDKYILQHLRLYFDGVRRCEILDICNGMEQASKCSLEVMPDSVCS